MCCCSWWPEAHRCPLDRRHVLLPYSRHTACCQSGSDPSGLGTSRVAPGALLAAGARWTGVHAEKAGPIRSRRSCAPPLAYEQMCVLLKEGIQARHRGLVICSCADVKVQCLHPWMCGCTEDGLLFWTPFYSALCSRLQKWCVHLKGMPSKGNKSKRQCESLIYSLKKGKYIYGISVNFRSYLLSLLVGMGLFARHSELL